MRSARVRTLGRTLGRTTIYLIVLVLLLLVAGLVWWALEGSAPRGDGPDANAPGADGGGPAAAVDSGAARKSHARSGKAWIDTGPGEISGTVREYGTERPLGGLSVVIEAGEPGPNRTLKAVSGADGRFHLGDVPAFENWTLRIDVPAPLADVEMAGIGVVAHQATALGTVYVSPAFTVEGSVVDEAGAPVADAEVQMIRAQPASSQMDVLRLLRDIGNEPPALDRAKSDAKGRFTLRKSVPGEYDAKIVAKGRRVTVEKGILVTPDANRPPLRFVVEPGFTIEGKVIREDGASPADIQVTAFISPRGESNFLVLDRMFAVTAKDGSFSIEGLGPGRHIVAALPAGEPFRIRDDVDVPTRGPIEIVIAGDSTLTGRITGTGGTGVSGANVYLIAEGTSNAPLIATARTGGEGRYEMKGLRSGPVMVLLVQAEGYSTWPGDLMSLLRSGRAGSMTLLPGPNTKDVSLEPGGVVKGVVKEKESGAPVEGARVELVTPLAMFGGARGTTSGPDGRFEIESVPIGEAVLVASKDGWFQPGVTPASLMAGMAMGGGKQGKIPADKGTGAKISIAGPGAAVERVLELSRGSTVRGVVTDPDGNPVPGARVQLVADQTGGQFGGMMRQIGQLFGGSEPRLTNGKGEFEISGPAPGQKGRVVASAQGFLEGRTDPVVARPGETVEGLAVKLRRGGTIEGRVEDQQGRPVSGATVRWAERESNDEWSLTWNLQNGQPTTTDAEGRFRVTQVETKKIAVEVTHPRYLPDLRKEVIVEEGRVFQVESKLELGAVMSGTVLGPDQKPRGGADVSADPEANELGWRPGTRARAGADGSFRFEGLAPGNYRVRATLQGYAPSDRATVSATAADVVLKLAPSFRIAGVVKNSGQGVGSVRVTLYRWQRPDGEDASASPEEDSAAQAGSHAGMNRMNVDNEVTDGQGRFTFDGVAGGNYDVEIGNGWWGEDRPNVLPKSVSNISAGAENVVIDVESGLTIVGKVVLGDGSNVPLGRVQAQRILEKGDVAQGGENSWANAAIVDGSFELVGLLPGKWTVSTQVEGAAVATRTVDAGSRDLRFELAQGGKITGRVVRPDGSAVPQCWVTAVAADDPTRQAGDSTDDEGRYTIESLGAGRYTVRAGVWNGAKGGSESGHAADVDVVADRSTTVPDVTIAPDQPAPGPK